MMATEGRNNTMMRPCKVLLAVLSTLLFMVGTSARESAKTKWLNGVKVMHTSIRGAPGQSFQELIGDSCG